MSETRLTGISVRTFAGAGAQPHGGERNGHRIDTFARKVLDESNRPVTCQARPNHPVRWRRDTTELSIATGLIKATPKNERIACRCPPPHLIGGDSGAVKL
jgi:hypothetical protein